MAHSVGKIGRVFDVTRQGTAFRLPHYGAPFM
jgi:hypothetical protein